MWYLRRYVLAQWSEDLPRRWLGSMGLAVELRWAAVRNYSVVAASVLIWHVVARAEKGENDVVPAAVGSNLHCNEEDIGVLMGDEIAAAEADGLRIAMAAVACRELSMLDEKDTILEAEAAEDNGTNVVGALYCVVAYRSFHAVEGGGVHQAAVAAASEEGGWHHNLAVGQRAQEEEEHFRDSPIDLERPAPQAEAVPAAAQRTVVHSHFCPQIRLAALAPHWPAASLARAAAPRSASFP